MKNNEKRGIKQMRSFMSVIYFLLLILPQMTKMDKDKKINKITQMHHRPTLPLRKTDKGNVTEAIRTGTL
jgi:hypothetical protein